MSRQNKQAKNLKRAKEFSIGRKTGQPGPSRTTPRHSKKNVNHRDSEVQKARAEVLTKAREARKGLPW